MTELELAAACEAALGPSRELDFWIGVRIEGTRHTDAELQADIDLLGIDGMLIPHAYTASIDAAMTLLPAKAANLDLFSFGSQPEWKWAFHFHDTGRTMGARAAKEQIARLNKSGVAGRALRGLPRVVMEKAIAEHWLEFYSTGAATAPLAICAAALHARTTGKEQ